MKKLAIITALITTLFAAAAYAQSIYAPNGKYLGELNSNTLDPNSVSNPIGRYGSQLSPDSINNPLGTYGSTLSNQSPNNPLRPPTAPPYPTNRSRGGIYPY